MKASLIFCLSLFLFSGLYAQTTIGVKSGYTKAWPNYGNIGLPEDAPTSVEGFHVSLTAYRSIGKKFSVGIEPGFVQRGMACLPGWQPIFEGDSRLLVDYVEAPVFIATTFNLFKSNFFVDAGLGYGVSLIAKAVREEFTMPEREIVDRRIMDPGNDEDFLNRLDHGAHGRLALGYDFKFGKIFTEGSYYHGLRDVERNNVSKNRSYNLSVGYRYSF